jgi:hypothetical protein
VAVDLCGAVVHGGAYSGTLNQLLRGYTHPAGYYGLGGLDVQPHTWNAGMLLTGENRAIRQKALAVEFMSQLNELAHATGLILYEWILTWLRGRRGDCLNGYAGRKELSSRFERL